MFMGEYSHSIDPKGRLIMPSRFREELGDSFVITKGLDGCLFVFTNEEWDKIMEKMRQIPMTNKDARRFQRFLVGSASNCEIDKQGRIRIPAALTEHGQLEKEVTIVGMTSRIEIWNREKWIENNSYDDMDEVTARMSAVDINI